MERWLGKWADRIYAVLRLVAGLLFACHGSQKLLGFPPPAREIEDTLGLVGAIIELVAGLLIAAGFFASPAAFLASGEMAVAYFMAHAPQGFWPIANRGELAVLYCFLFLYIAARGSGTWSLDSLRRRRT
jgi:putative oxidoreductase